MAKGVSTVGTASQQVAKLRSRGFIALEIDGALLVIDGLEQSGRLEPRARLADL